MYASLDLWSHRPYRTITPPPPSSSASAPPWLPSSPKHFQNSPSFFKFHFHFYLHPPLFFALGISRPGLSHNQNLSGSLPPPPAPFPHPPCPVCAGGVSCGCASSRPSAVLSSTTQACPDARVNQWLPLSTRHRLQTAREMRQTLLRLLEDLP